MSAAYLQDPDVTLYHGDVLTTLRELEAESVDCVVTSPPYWGLRSYLADGHDDKPKELGLEPTPEQYVERMVEVFREVRRVLAPHGTVWLNLGDSYAGGGPNRASDKRATEMADGDRSPPPGLKPKDLVGIPWRVAFALQADGWYLRSDIIWSKPNPMPESVTDRPTKAHEMVFLLAKGAWIGREPGPIEKRLSREDARWLALLVDAEGNICVKRVAPQGDNSPQYGAQIAVGSTSRELLERARDLVGAGNVLERKGTNAPMFYWQVSNKVAQDLLYAIYPHLIVKPRQARIAIHLESLLYHRGNATKRTDRENAVLAALWTRNKECNQFGTPDLSDVPAPKYGKWGAARYFFDQEAVREAHTSPFRRVPAETFVRDDKYGDDGKGIDARRRGSALSDAYAGGPPGNPNGRNIRSVWEIATQPYPDAHFATFPEELARRCIAAGCPEQVCGVCGKARERVVERGELVGTDRGGNYRGRESDADNAGNVNRFAYTDGREHRPGMSYERLDAGFTDCGCTLTEGFGSSGAPAADSSSESLSERNCACVNFGPDTKDGDLGEIAPKYRPGIVLDPFIGSGTVCHVARKLGRRSVGVDLSAEYLALAARRLQQQSLFAEPAA